MLGFSAAWRHSRGLVDRFECQEMPSHHARVTITGGYLECPGMCRGIEQYREGHSTRLGLVAIMLHASIDLDNSKEIVSQTLNG